MDLRSHYPYSLMNNGLVAAYPSLPHNVTADVAVIGAGISGALVAYALKDDASCVVIDRRHAGMGSTAASTSLLQYEIDTPITKLQHMVGLEHAVRSYMLCSDSIFRLQEISGEVGNPFALVPSLQYASYNKHVADLHDEYQLRRKHGFDIRWLTDTDMERLYGFRAPAAVLSEAGASVDAYMLTHLLLQHCAQAGHAVFDNTTVTRITHGKGRVVLHTDTGHTVSARRLVIACGYESLQYIPKQVATIHSTYAFVTEPFCAKDFWHRRSLIWETKMPYLYMRVTDDDRIIAGGLDDNFYNPHHRDALVKRKAALLARKVNKLFPAINTRPDFSWAGAFAATKDGLPYIGMYHGIPNTYFALGFGGNGITFSVVAADIIRDGVLGRKNRDAKLFGFDR
ncbi:MAG: FAD-binding oxidoreductase [Bacteroidota bacterium]